MWLLDANLLIYSFREELPQHEKAREWLLRVLGKQAVGLPTLAETAFLRLVTKPLGPLTAAPWSEAWGFIGALLSHPQVRRIVPGARHPEILDQLARQHELRGDQLTDGWLAALALEQDAVMASADRGFARFTGLRWSNPLDP